MEYRTRTFHPTRTREMAAYIAATLRSGKAVETYTKPSGLVAVQAISVRDDRG